MAFFEWDAKYSINNEMVDKHHKSLVELVNQYYEKLTDKSEDGQKKAGKVFQELKNYTIMHFKAEEELMASCKYPDLENHKKLHQALLNSVIEYENKIKNKETISPLTIGNFLKNWLLTHILNEDKKISAHIKK